MKGFGFGCSGMLMNGVLCCILALVVCFGMASCDSGREAQPAPKTVITCEKAMIPDGPVLEKLAHIRIGMPIDAIETDLGKGHRNSMYDGRLTMVKYFVALEESQAVINVQFLILLGFGSCFVVG